MGVTVYSLDENLVCFCRHKWKEHVKVFVTNPKYINYPLAFSGYMAYQCEHRICGQYFVQKKPPCKCDGFRPRAQNVQKIVNEWVKTNG